MTEYEWELNTFYTQMVTTRLSLDDAKQKGWLLDGYPRSAAQAQSLQELGVWPDIYIVLEVHYLLLVDPYLEVSC